MSNVKDVALRAIKVATLPTVLAGITPGELANALVMRDGPKLEPDDLEKSVVDALNFLRDAAAALEAHIKRVDDARKATAE